MIRGSTLLFYQYQSAPGGPLLQQFHLGSRRHRIPTASKFTRLHALTVVLDTVPEIDECSADLRGWQGTVSCVLSPSSYQSRLYTRSRTEKGNREVVIPFYACCGLQNTKIISAISSSLDICSTIANVLLSCPRLGPFTVLGLVQRWMPFQSSFLDKKGFANMVCLRSRGGFLLQLLRRLSESPASLLCLLCSKLVA